MKPSSPSPARDVALLAVTASLGPDRFDLQAALNHALDRRGLDPRDVALATELAYGFTRLKGRADFILTGYLKDPAKLPHEVKLALGLAAYELIFLDKSPSHAVVNWTVEAVKTRFGDGLAKLANAVSRRLADLGHGPREEAFYRKSAASEPEFLSRWLSCPRWIVEALIRDHGMDATREFLAAQLVKPPIGLRCNASKSASRAAFDDLAAEHPHQGRFPTLALDPGSRPAGIAELEQSGLISRQSAASQLILQALAPQTWPGPILDVCSGRGGKTCLLLEAGLPVMAACDLSRHRLRQLDRELARLGLPRIALVQSDATAWPPLRSTPGTILIDAPCTGFGVLARRPDAKWKRGRADASKLMALQAAILSRAYDNLAVGGRLAYITCTLLRSENELQLQHLAKNKNGVKIVAQDQTTVNSGLGEFFYGALIEKN